MSHHKKKHNFIIPTFVLLLIMVGQSAVDTYLPSLPALVNDLFTSESKVQLTLTTFLLGISSSQLIYGPVSEKYGRRPILLFGLSVFTLASISCSFANSIEVLLLSRLLQGIGAGAASLLSRVIMRDVFGGKSLVRLASYALMAWACVPMLAPLIGGYIQESIGWRANFAALALFSALLLFSIYFLLPETRNHDHSEHPERKSILASYKSLLSSKIFLGYTLCVSIFFGVFVTFNAIGPFLLQIDLNLSPLQYSWIVTLVCSGLLIGSFTNSKLSKNFNQDKLILTGFCIFFSATIPMLLLALAHILNIYAIIIPLLITQFSLGLIIPNCMAGCMQPFPHIAGVAGSIFGFLFLGTSAITSFIVSGVSNGGHIPLALTILILGIIGSLLFTALILKPTKRKKKPTFV